MRTVKAIKKKEKLNRMLRLIKEDGKIKEFTYCIIGLNTALRVSDILALKWENVFKNNKMKDTFDIQEKKTKKPKEIKINKTVKKALKELREINPKDIFLFQSESNRVRKEKPWSRQYVNKFLKEYCLKANIKQNIGSHSLRKTFGYFAFKSGVSLTNLSEIFNHSSQAITRKYIGLTQDTLNSIYDKIQIGL